MSTTTDFIAELVRAANEVEKLAPIERQRLFARTMITVQEMRRSIKIPSAQEDADKVVELQSLVAQIGAAAETPEQVRDALLTAAGMIRELHIVLDTGGRNSD